MIAGGLKYEFALRLCYSEFDECNVFFFQAEDGIRDHAQSRGLGDVYKRQELLPASSASNGTVRGGVVAPVLLREAGLPAAACPLRHPGIFPEGTLDRCCG
eukprot:TRINITY_DN11497_c0_g1_i2.p2 TRINITY_DN11497_c0_g1~~TRINITY_DN11497_c0_g1_i2.p2  ORF type:complete len:101 (-),score=6.27 TRINITY_DN11497_c0_g1_i2:64-366(-)